MQLRWGSGKRQSRMKLVESEGPLKLEIPIEVNAKACALPNFQLNFGIGLLVVSLTGFKATNDTLRNR